MSSREPSGAASSTDPVTGVRFYGPSHPWGHDTSLWPYFPDVRIERSHYHAKSGGAQSADHDVHALHDPYRRAGARHRGSAVHGRGAAGQIDLVTGKRVTFAAFPWRWTKGDGCIVRLVALVDPSGRFRLESREDG